MLASSRLTHRCSLATILSPEPHRRGALQGKGKTNDGERTTGGTSGGILPKGSNKVMSVHKDYTLDYTSPLKDVIMEAEHGSGGLTYRYTYGLQKVSTVISNVPNGAGELLQNGKVKLYYHHDRLGSTDFLTDNVKAKVTSYVEYDPWGALLSKAIVKLNQRELDLVQEYTGHPYDQVLGLYFAEARMYDAVDRRFVAMDFVKGTTSYPSTLVPYLYVLNNPIAFVDLNGMFLEGMNLTEGAKGEDIKDLAVALYEWEKRTTGITKHLTNYVNKEKGEWWNALQSDNSILKQAADLHGYTNDSDDEFYLLSAIIEYKWYTQKTPLRATPLSVHSSDLLYRAPSSNKQPRSSFSSRVDYNTWVGLGLSVNETLEDEFDNWLGKRGGGSISYSN